MVVLSTFQRLPLHIADAIAGYCISSRLEIDDMLDTFNKSARVWTTLYSVSYSWRELALKYFLSVLTIDIHVVKEKEQFEFPCLPDEIELDTIHYSYVKRVEIETLDTVEPQNTLALKDFSSAWPENVVFPAARELYVELSGLLYQKFDKCSATENERFYWISQRIQTSLPKLQKVIISGFGADNLRASWPHSSEWKADVFLSAIFGKATELHINTNTINLTSSLSVMENGPMLTRIGCIFTSKNELFPHLIEKSAPILESLEFKDEALLNVKALIFDDKGQPMVYPRLRRLDVSTGNTLMPGDRLCVDKRIAPFPNLRYLRWHSIYAFEDDTLFRGNSGTLECMDILVDTNLADTLQRRKVFADCKYSQLCNVSVGIIDANDTIPLELDTFIRLSVNFVVPATKSFTLDFVDLSDIAGLVAESQHLGNIQHLNLTGYTGRLQHLLTIVKLMPSMTKLTCRRDINELGPGNLDLGSFIDGLYIMYYPLSHRLRYWEVLVGSDNEIENIAASALALAALCTDFVLAYVPLRYREAFGHRIKEAIESGLYDKYLDKIQRLLRIMD